MIDPLHPPVRPRVIAERSSGPVLLADLVAEMASAGDFAHLGLYGPHGAGTTTALRYIEELHGTQFNLTFTDLHSPATVLEQQASGLICFPLNESHRRLCELKCKIAGWGRDEWIEYLLSVHKERCGSVMRRLQADSTTSSLSGNANLWSQVLDELASDESLPDLKAATVRVIKRQFPDDAVRLEIGERILATESGAEVDVSPDSMPLDVEQARLLHIPVIRKLLAAEAAWDELNSTALRSVAPKWPRNVVQEIGARISVSASIQERLLSWLESEYLHYHSLAASLLHAAGISWCTLRARNCGVTQRPLWLQGAFLDEIDCLGMDLSYWTLADASCSDARFTDSNLEGVDAVRARFDGACFQLADLSGFKGNQSCFVGADLSEVQGDEVSLGEADLSFATLSEAKFTNGWFVGANLSNAILRHANLQRCRFQKAKLDDADFSGADLKGAFLQELDLTVADFAEACFTEAHLSQCLMEGMDLPDADFERAYLRNAIMTGSMMPRANFSQADLSGSRLAEVQWESANLWGADLTGATFHMGSTRSGLVGSIIQSHGSRTGFYTDELHEQDFKSPEEIRKANLRGADLREAKIDHVDFYLVDLRDALFDPDQEEQLRRTGAILG